ncbi:hypothetical protein D3C77_545620 [compost metagenome]
MHVPRLLCMLQLLRLLRLLRLLCEHTQIASALIFADTIIPPNFTRLIFMTKEVVQLHKAEYNLRCLQRTLAEELMQTEK